VDTTFVNELPARDCAVEAAPDGAEFARRRLGLRPDERQEEVLRSEAKRGILLCTRQWGKSTIAAAKGVHRAFTRPESLVLVASPTYRQSGELVRKAAGMMRRLGLPARGDGGPDASLVFPNGSRIVGLPGIEGTVRGLSAASLLLIDEASRVHDGMYKALRPMLAVGDGDLWMMSTPWHRRGFFYEAWEHGADWMKVKVPATECPRISKMFLEEERSALGAMWFDREYMCCFRDEGSGYFPREVVEGAIANSVAPLDFGRIWRD
jgi:hypothetical protein